MTLNVFPVIIPVYGREDAFATVALGIEWSKVDAELKLSEKDQKHPCLKDIDPWEV